MRNVQGLTGDIYTYLATVKTIFITYIRIHISTECREHVSTRGDVDVNVDASAHTAPGACQTREY